jgi:hypothetical protein
MLIRARADPPLEFDAPLFRNSNFRLLYRELFGFDSPNSVCRKTDQASDGNAVSSGTTSGISAQWKSCRALKTFWQQEWATVVVSATRNMVRMTVCES